MEWGGAIKFCSRFPASSTETRGSRKGEYPQPPPRMPDKEKSTIVHEKNLHLWKQNINEFTRVHSSEHNKSTSIYWWYVFHTTGTPFDESFKSTAYRQRNARKYTPTTHHHAKNNTKPDFFLPPRNKKRPRGGLPVARGFRPGSKGLPRCRCPRSTPPGNTATPRRGFPWLPGVYPCCTERVIGPPLWRSRSTCSFWGNTRARKRRRREG